MRSFIGAVTLAIVLAAVGGFALNSIQEPVATAFATSAVRL